MNSKIKFYPVANGDQTLIRLSDGTTINVDCNIRAGEKDTAGNQIYDVKKDLLKQLRTTNGIYHLDTFILTHGDQDHCRGFKEHFYTGDPSKYGETNKTKNEIIIDEMWFSPMIAEKHSNDDEDAYQTEAERRLELHNSNSVSKDLAGNRIRIIGYDGSKDYSKLNHLRSIPGDEVDVINGSKKSNFSFFIHAPFKEQLVDEEKDKNYNSIVLQARFKKSTNIKNEFACLLMLSGDANHEAWELIIKKTKEHKNDTNKMALKWNILLAPHHCSWTFFNDTPQKDYPDAKETSMELLDNGLAKRYIISSSKKIINNDDNPPHYKAKQKYLESLSSETNFINTAIHQSESKPEPIIFEITKDGFEKCKSEAEELASSAIASTTLLGQSPIKKPWAC